MGPRNSCQVTSMKEMSTVPVHSKFAKHANGVLTANGNRKSGKAMMKGMRATPRGDVTLSSPSGKTGGCQHTCTISSSF